MKQLILKHWPLSKRSSKNIKKRIHHEKTTDAEKNGVQKNVQSK